jgi:trehalose utilization protein
VVVWDEQQPIQKQAYENFLGNAIAEYLKQSGRNRDGEGLSVKSVRLDDPGQGLSKEVLDECDVLIWWGHARHGEVKDELVKDIVGRLQSGRLSLIALHSAHWSKPFIEAMNARSIADALNTLVPDRRAREAAKVETIAPPRRLVQDSDPPTPSARLKEGTAGPVVEVRLPSCVFPVVRNDGKPSHVRIMMKQHPIARGLPEQFDIPQTEVYGGPFHVPRPDAVIMEERWDLGETFPSACLWNVGKGKVFYFRPGHETYPIFKQLEVLKVVENAVRWLRNQ